MKESQECPYFSTDKQLKLIGENEAWKKIFQKEPGLKQLIHDPDQLKTILPILENPATVYPIQIEFDLMGQNQQVLPYTWTVLSNVNTFDFYGVFLGSRKELETRYERMYHTTTDAIMLLSKESFTDCNQATLNIFKLNTIADFIKCHPADLSPPFQPDGESSLTKANRMIEKAVREGRSFFEWTHRDSQGNNFPCEVLLNRMEIDGKFYLQASVRDISERIRMQKEVDETRISQVNAARLASLGEMAGGIAHEINNPMAIIRGQAEYLQRFLRNVDSVQAGPIVKGLDKIVTTVDRITKIIKGLRAVSRDSSQDPMINQDLLEIISDTLTLFEEKFKLANIRYELKTSEEKLVIACRPAEISQVILNLMNNSYDAILGTEYPWINITVERDKNSVFITFSDSGESIPETIAQKIFQPFYTTKEVGKGTGLGLSISKSIVERHGGKFYLDRSKKSTTFQVVLPLSE